MKFSLYCPNICDNSSRDDSFYCHECTQKMMRDEEIQFTAEEIGCSIEFVEKNYNQIFDLSYTFDDWQALHKLYKVLASIKTYNQKITALKYLELFNKKYNTNYKFNL